MPYADPEVRRRYALAYREKNRKKIQAQTLAWKRDNRAATRRSNSASWYRRCNEDIRRYLTQLVKYSRRRHKDHTITIDDIFSMWEVQKGMCALTGVPMTHIVGHGTGTGYHTNVSIDRVNSSLGYSPSNTRLVCFMVNVMRRNMDDTEFTHWCRLVVDKVQCR